MRHAVKMWQVDPKDLKPIRKRYSNLWFAQLVGLRSRDGKTWLSTNVFVRRRLVRIALKRYQGKLSQDTSKLVLGLVKENTVVISVITKRIGKISLKGKLKWEDSLPFTPPSLHPLPLPFLKRSLNNILYDTGTKKNTTRSISSVKSVTIRHSEKMPWRTTRRGTTVRRRRQFQEWCS